MLCPLLPPHHSMIAELKLFKRACLYQLNFSSSYLDKNWAHFASQFFARSPYYQRRQRGAHIIYRFTDLLCLTNLTQRKTVRNYLIERTYLKYTLWAGYKPLWNLIRPDKCYEKNVFFESTRKQYWPSISHHYLFFWKLSWLKGSHSMNTMIIKSVRGWSVRTNIRTVHTKSKTASGHISTTCAPLRANRKAQDTR